MRRSAVAITFLGAFLLAAPVLRADDGNDDIEEYRSCSYCGMDRKAFGYSRMLIKYADGSAVGVCSLHCAIIELAARSSQPVAALLVADRDSRNLIDAGRAVWVTGGKKRGVMTQTPVWAFGSKEAAESFIRDYGGTIATWQDVFTAAKEEVAREDRWNR
jgi:nitrous oxide reductase accessory protein NosL